MQLFHRFEKARVPSSGYGGFRLAFAGLPFLPDFVTPLT
jgi:hypothetical protein